jgi:MFS transporter, DHA2 family, multidrug resistance protein
MTSAPTATGDWRPSHNPWLIGISVLLATFMEVLDTSVANVSLRHIAGNLSATIEEATWVLTSYLVANAVVLCATGWLSTYFGRKRYLAFSVLIFTLASALCGAAQTLPQLIVARILQGLGGGGLQPLAQAILLESFPKERRGPAMAAYGMGIVVAPIIGPTLGGWITDNFSWRWIFYINVPIGLIGLFMQSVFLEDPPYLKQARPKKIDYLGFAFMVLGIGLLQLVLDKGQEDDWFGSQWICWGTAISLVSLVAFVLWELACKEPLVRLRVLRNRNLAVGTFLVMLLGAVLYGTTVTIPIFMQTLLHYPAEVAGWAMTPRGLGSMLSMILIGKLVMKVDGRYLLTIGFSGLGVTCLLLSHLNLEISHAQISWPLFFSGMSMGFIFVPLTTLAVSTLRQNEIHQATPLFSLMRNIGGSMGISALVTYQARAAQTYQTELVSHLTPYTPQYQMWLHKMAAQLPAGLASPRGLQGLAYRHVIEQANLLSYVASFRWLFVACLLCVPFIFLFKRGMHKAQGPSAGSGGR